MGLVVLTCLLPAAPLHRQDSQIYARSAWTLRKAMQLKGSNIPWSKVLNIGALIRRIGVMGPLYYRYNKEPNIVLVIF